MKETIKSMQAIAEPFLAFLRWEASSGVILLACAILALIVANSPLAESYEHLLHYPIAIGAGEYVLEMGLLHWINDGLMAVFFFVIGLEIKREFLYGELDRLRRVLRGDDEIVRNFHLEGQHVSQANGCVRRCRTRERPRRPGTRPPRRRIRGRIRPCGFCRRVPLPSRRPSCGTR